MEGQWPEDPRPHDPHEQQEAPEAQPHLADRPEPGDEEDKNEQLHHERPHVERFQPSNRARGCPAPRREEEECGGGGRCAGHEEQCAEPRTVCPDRAVRDRQEDARVPRDEEPQQAADGGHQLGDCAGRLGAPRNQCAGPEQQDRPRAERDRRKAFEHEVWDVVGLKQHVPEAQRPAEVEGQQRAGDDRSPERQRVRGADDGTIFGSTEPFEARREEIRAAGEATDKEVGNDEPCPMRRPREEGVRHS